MDTNRPALVFALLLAAATVGAFFYAREAAKKDESPYIKIPIPSPCPDGKCPWVPRPK